MTHAAGSNPRVRRVYDPPEPDDGARVLVDRLWPRGLAKADAELDDWPKALTPSTELRRWYHATDQDEAAYARFRTRYLTELAEPEAAAALAALAERVAAGPVTLLTASKYPERSHASVLRERLA
ncbi:uncharacterized protein YeaO (DUF488 family) [Streptacidiphilus sp. MAP12-33]|uniref:DUF488 domain-containing protein n=1 Tax=Streptacidiphilus sp. MAP12-33 TaxID=3156266 RepID=UPI0035119F2B